MKRKAICSIASILLIPVFCATAQTATEQAYLDDALGLWSSEGQSISEDYDWVLSKKAQIMTEREDGVWVYQENAIQGANPESMVPETPPAPYFQVAIHLRDIGDGLLHTTTHRIANRAAALACSDGECEFDMAWLGDVACMGTMQRVGAGFWEGAATCPNGYKGGVKVESWSVRAPGIHVNWDRGFDADSNHIWGPARGGYIFKQVAE